MEPETMFAKKIRLVEQEPVHWKKAEVWFRIHEQVSTNRKSLRFYYYAAAVIFFMFFNIYQLQHRSSESLALKDQFSSRSEGQMLSVENELLDDVDTAIQTDIINSENVLTQNTFHVHEIAMLEPESLEEVNIEVVIEEPPVHSVTETTIQQKVEPIVGVIQLPESNTASVKPKRKKLFLKLEQDESEFDKSHQNTIVIARIK